MSFFLGNPLNRRGSGGTGTVNVKPASTIESGIAKFAKHNEKGSLLAVQADDPRLEREVIISSVEPQNKNALWIDTNDRNAIKTKIFDILTSSWIETTGAVDNSFLSLNDVPHSYIGQKNKVLKVNSTQTGIEFSDIRFTDLVESPKDLSSNAGKFLAVNSSGTGLEFKTPDTGIKNLSGFTTADLPDSPNRRYITDNEKSKLNQLDGIIVDQQTITNNLNTLNSKISNLASSSNKLITNSEVQSLINSIKFTNLPDVPTLRPNAFLVVNSSGTGLDQIDNLETSITRISDNNRDEFYNVKEILFNKLEGNEIGEGILELTPVLRSTDIVDFPSTLTHGALLVCNADTAKYEHKTIDELTFSKENYVAEINETDWTFNDTLGKYEYTLVHTLDSFNLIAAFYDIDNNYISLPYKIVNVTSIKVFSDSTIYVKVVLNCSLGTSSPDYGRLPPVYNFLDDTMSRTDKTYSSSKIESKLLEYAKKNTVYSKIESDNKYALKINEHNHSNLSVLNDFSVDSNGDLLWKNRKLLSKVEPFFYQMSWTDEVKENLEMIVNVYDIYTSLNYTTIINSELLIKNTKPIIDPETDEQNQLTLIIMDDGIEIVNTRINPQERQKFILGMSPNIKIYVKGQFDGKFYIGAF